LSHHAKLITGDVLEVKSAVYTHRYGVGDIRSHVLDIDPDNTGATIIGDLCDPEILSPHTFDCVILTQTLQFIEDPRAGLRNLWNSLRPRGALLVTVPCLARVDPELPESDLWRWTPAGLKALFVECFAGASIEVSGRGNLVVALSTLLGLGVTDLRGSELDDDDADFPVTACALARKP
jgi:SAM-dependent methyltransferase